MNQDTVDNPDWENASKIHDWRNYVGERTRAIWDKLAPWHRLAIAEDAQDMADREEWN